MPDSTSLDATFTLDLAGNFEQVIKQSEVATRNLLKASKEATKLTKKFDDALVKTGQSVKQKAKAEKDAAKVAERASNVERKAQIAKELQAVKTNDKLRVLREKESIVRTRAVETTQAKVEASTSKHSQKLVRIEERRIAKLQRNRARARLKNIKGAKRESAKLEALQAKRAADSKALFAAGASGLAGTAGNIGTVGAVASGLSIRESLRFAESIASIQTIAKGAGSATSELRQEVFALQGQFGGDAATQSAAIKQAISSGATELEQRTAVVIAANKLATGGFAELEDSIQVVTGTLNAFNLPMEQAGNVTDALFATTEGGVTTISELSAQLGNVSSLAASAGFSVEELTAVIAALTAKGQKTETAITGIKAVISNVLKPTSEAEKEFKRLGIAFDIASLKAEGPEAFLRKIVENGKFSDKTLSRLFGSTEALGAVLGLTGDGLKKFGEELKRQANNAGTTAKAFDKIDKSPTGDLKKRRAELQKLGIELGDALVPALLEVTKELAPMVKEFAEFARKNPETIATVVKLMVASKALGFAFGPLGDAIKLVRGASGLLGLASSAGTATAAMGGLLTKIGSVGRAAAGLVGVGGALFGATAAVGAVGVGLNFQEQDRQQALTEGTQQGLLGASRSATGAGLGDAQADFERLLSETATKQAGRTSQSFLGAGGGGGGRSISAEQREQQLRGSVDAQLQRALSGETLTDDSTAALVTARQRVLEEQRALSRGQQAGSIGQVDSGESLSNATSVFQPVFHTPVPAQQSVDSVDASNRELLDIMSELLEATRQNRPKNNLGTRPATSGRSQ